MHTIALLIHGHGHITIGWPPENDAWVLPMIQKKLDAKCTFWVRSPRNRIIPITNISEIGAVREVIIQDDDVRDLLANKHIELVADDEDELEGFQKVKTAEEIIKNDTIMINAGKGG